jgi:hypothetical protein
MANPFQVNVPNAFEALMIGSKAYDGASMDRALSDASQAIKTGDNKALMDALLRAKQIGPAIEVAKLDRQSAAAQQFGQAIRRSPRCRSGSPSVLSLHYRGS